jgi:hypothetical protein
VTVSLLPHSPQSSRGSSGRRARRSMRRWSLEYLCRQTFEQVRTFGRGAASRRPDGHTRRRTAWLRRRAAGEGPDRSARRRATRGSARTTQGPCGKAKRRELSAQARNLRRAVPSPSSVTTTDRQAGDLGPQDLNEAGRFLRYADASTATVSRSRALTGSCAERDRPRPPGNWRYCADGRRQPRPAARGGSSWPSRCSSWSSTNPSRRCDGST